MSETRACSKCKIAKPVATGFYRKAYKGNSRRDGYHSWCKECMKQERRIARTCVGCGVTYFHAGSAGSRRKVCDQCHVKGRVCAGCNEFKSLDRFYSLSRYCKDGCALAMNRKRLYGLDEAQYKRLVVDAGGKCPACGNLDRILVVDHCHDSGRIRGLLCGPCNSGMGMFGDSIDAMKGAITYLESFSSS